MPLSVMLMLHRLRSWPMDVGSCLMRQSSSLRLVRPEQQQYWK
jgi:hypothetical protein